MGPVLLLCALPRHAVFPLKSEGAEGAKAENVAGEKQCVLSGQILITRFYATLTIEFL